MTASGRQQKEQKVLWMHMSNEDQTLLKKLQISLYMGAVR
jgi:hypothetical protein